MFRWLGLVVFLTACTVEPTKTTVTQEREFLQVREKAEKPLDVQEETTILDTRPSFSYGLNHVRNSHLFPWSNLAESAAKGELLRDPHQAALRLSLQGLTPETPVLIVGEGVHGSGEEGRLAWSMLYFGYKDVQVASTEALRAAMTQDPSAPPTSVAAPLLHLRSDLQIGREEFLKLPKGSKILDVRSNSEAQNSGYENFEWKNLYTAQGRPDYRAKRKLSAIGLSKDSEIIVISNRGVRSGSAAYALLALGFSKTRNFTAGFDSLKNN